MERFCDDGRGAGDYTDGADHLSHERELPKKKEVGIGLDEFEEAKFMPMHLLKLI